MLRGHLLTFDTEVSENKNNSKNGDMSQAGFKVVMYIVSASYCSVMNSPQISATNIEHYFYFIISYSSVDEVSGSSSAGSQGLS